MELRRLRYFLALADTMHFGEAANRLGIAQPGLSQQIRRLEEEIGVQLVERGRRTIRLTDAGAALIEPARRCLAEADAARVAARQAGRGASGHIRLGQLGSAAFTVLPTVLRVLADRYPGIEVELLEATTGEQLRGLREGHLDACFLHPPRIDPSLQTLVVAREQLIVALPSSHDLAPKQEVDVRTLAPLPFILFNREADPTYYDSVVVLCRRAGFSPRITHETNSLQTMLGLVSAGLGISLVPSSAQRFTRDGTVLRLLRPSPNHLCLALMWRRDDPSSALRTLCKITRNVTRLASTGEDPSAARSTR